ncbi:MAG: hypothetical protein K9J17_03065 [Flavobacteriales bacterium]|nr:hypothetical protein [Flavobacteriales bacterium]
MKFKYLSFVSLALLASCDDFTKPHEAAFTANGTGYTCGEDDVSASYYNTTENHLQVVAYANGSEKHSLAIVVDLDRVKEVVALDSAQEGCYFLWANSSIYYTVVSGQWEITEYEEGNPASRHTEGNFEFIAVNPYDSADTVRVTNGSFYVNNY